VPVSDSLRDALLHDGIEPLDSDEARRVGGGDISEAYRLPTANGPVFLKTGSVADAEPFEAEAAGLIALAAPRALRVPRVLACGSHGDGSYLALEWIEFERGGRRAEEQLGRRLAALHRSTAAQHGWHRDNRIGLTPQVNEWTADWCEFWSRHRLGWQLRLAARQGYDGGLQQLGARLIGRLPALLEGHAPVPSLLHGDLWGGNWAVSGGEPVIYDPAVYYGDREADLAMTRLFGGFGRAFYESYESAWPLPPGHERRLPLYQLYHVLNHLNIFGGGYLGRAESLMRQLLEFAG